MPHFCFVSFLQPGHMDFGGQGFTRLAEQLMRRGHRVTWTFSYSESKDFYKRASAILSDAGIEYDKINRFYLTIHHHHHNFLESAADLERVIRTQRYDCIVIDRLCVGAGYAAEWAGVPWAVVGTDGREWALVKTNQGRAVLAPKADDADVHVQKSKQRDLVSTGSVVSSYWAVSPYLNMSFFPRSYYSGDERSGIPGHSHFLGSGDDGASREEGNVVLVALGNSFNLSIVTKLIRCVLSVLENRAASVLLLTGNDELTKKLKNEFRSFNRLSIDSWMPYEKAYRAASIAVGHGGTSHVWTGMRNAVPLLVLPSKGDQAFGAKRVEKLNIGLALNVNCALGSDSTPLSFIKNAISDRGDVFVSRCTHALARLLDDPAIREASRSVSRQIRSGGGVEAGVSLLEQLVRRKAPITQCISGRCCC